MRERPIIKFRPGLEPLEVKRALSVSASAAPFVHLKVGSGAPAPRPAETPGAPGAVGALPGHGAARGGDGSPPVNTDQPISAQAVKPHFGYLLFRRTNPNQFDNKLIPPFGHVLVQARQPVPGQVYNILFVVVRNGTARTFDASSGFSVKFPGQRTSFPILTGTEQWKPGQNFVFYVLTKKYYPLPNQVTSGFEFDLGGARSVAIPGPSGIFLRLKYDPATFARTLDAIAAFGPGAEGGSGVRTGIADTAINEFVSARTRRNDFGGYF